MFNISLLMVSLFLLQHIGVQDSSPSSYNFKKCDTFYFISFYFLFMYYSSYFTRYYIYFMIKKFFVFFFGNNFIEKEFFVQIKMKGNWMKTKYFIKSRKWRKDLQLSATIYFIDVWMLWLLTEKNCLCLIMDRKNRVMIELNFHELKQKKLISQIF